MIPKTTKMRVARPTDNLREITKMYIEGLGFKLLGGFENHNDFDGSIIGHENHNYHLEFTHHKGTEVGKAPTQDNLLVFYFSEQKDWESCCIKMLDSGFIEVSSFNENQGVSQLDLLSGGFRVHSAPYPPIDDLPLC